MKINKDQPSKFKFLWIEIIFRKEDEKWYRLIIISLALIAIIIIFIKLKEWIAPTLIIDKVSQLKVSNIISLLKNKP